MIYNVVLVSDGQQSDSVTHIHVTILFQIVFHIVPSAVQWVLVVYFIYNSVFPLNPNSQFILCLTLW